MRIFEDKSFSLEIFLLTSSLWSYTPRKFFRSYNLFTIVDNCKAFLPLLWEGVLFTPDPLAVFPFILLLLFFIQARFFPKKQSMDITNKRLNYKLSQ